MNVFEKIYFNSMRPSYIARQEIGRCLKETIKKLSITYPFISFTDLEDKDVIRMNSLIKKYGKEEAQKHIAYWCNKLRIEVRCLAPIGEGNIQIKQIERRNRKT